MSEIIEMGRRAIQQQLNQIPEGKNHAVVVAFDKQGMVPWVRVGVASRVNNVWSLGASIEARAKERPTIGVYTAWVW